MADNNSDNSLPEDLVDVPLSWIPKGINAGDVFSVTLVGRSGTDALIKLTNPAAQLQNMSTGQLQNFLMQQMSTRNATNPPAPVVQPQQPLPPVQ